MTSPFVSDPNGWCPASPETHIPTGSIDAVMKPATSIFLGATGTIAANMSITGPIQLIIGFSFQSSGIGLQCIMMDSSSAVRTRYASPRSRMKTGERVLLRT